MTDTFKPDDSFGDFLATNQIWPDVENSKDFNYRLQQTHRRIVDTVNNREIASYLAVTPSGGQTTDVETPTGQSWFGGQSDSQSNYSRQTYRKVIDFGALPNAASKTVAHGVNFDTNSTMTRMYGAATDPTGISFLPIPNSDINLSVDATDVKITTTVNYAAYTRCVVVLEYLKN